ncbi:MAG: glycosyltransferase [Candidatus Zipacnadales bacterium]
MSLRIAVFTNTYRPTVNGVVNSIEAFRKGLEAAGHTVFIFAPSNKDQREPDDFVLRFPSHTFVRYPDYPIGLPFTRRLAHTARELAPDLVHTQHPWLIGAWGQRFARQQGLPLVTTIHTQYEMYAHYAWPLPPSVIRRVLRSTVLRHCNRCDVVATPGKAMQQYLVELGVTRPVEVVPNATDLSGFDTADGSGVRARFGIRAEEVLYLFVGRAAKEKSLDQLILAFTLVAQQLPTAKLMIVGGGPELEALRALAHQQPCAERILLPGPVPYEKVREYHAAGDIFVTASVTEVQPLSLTETMAAGNPIVGFEAGGISDMVRHGETCWLASPKEGQAGLARAMLELGRDRALRERLAQAARLASRCYDIPVATERLLRMYEQALALHSQTRKGCLRSGRVL